MNSWHGEEKLYIEPFVAWRAWQVCPDFRLRSTGFTVGKSVWAYPSDQYKAGLCNDRNGRSVQSGGTHDAPKFDCRCGLYCVKRAEDVSRHAGVPKPGGSIVVGQISISGRIIVATEGYRAQYARIDRLFVPGMDESTYDLAKWLYSVYDPPNESPIGKRVTRTCDRLKERYEVPVYVFTDLGQLCDPEWLHIRPSKYHSTAIEQNPFDSDTNPR